MKILGIELGSTRIKAVLTDENAAVLAKGSYVWENQYVNELWTYDLKEAVNGLQKSFSALNREYEESFGTPVTEVSAIGISGMMHGYLAFDKDNRLLVPFRTWRNTNTTAAAEELSELLHFNIPERWSVAHLYQAILNKEPHIGEVAFITTLAGYIHFLLTGKKVVGIGEASGMFPIKNNKYNSEILGKVNRLIEDKGINKRLEDILPQIMTAGENAGFLSADGAKLIDPTGHLKAGCLLCPPEGDGPTGMAATNCVKPRTANVSAGTSGFLMAILEKDMDNFYKEIDVINSPTGAPVAMIHVNNFTSEINAWLDLFSEVSALSGSKIDKGELIEKLFEKSTGSDDDFGKLVGYNFLSGEPIASAKSGRPLMFRFPQSRLTLSNFMQMQIYSALGALALGMNILRGENIHIDYVCGHGGFFKTEFVGQNAMSAAIKTPVTIMENSGEGGAWGIALLALYALKKEGTLSEFLDKLFNDVKMNTVMADDAEIKKFDKFLSMYENGLKIEKLAGEVKYNA